MVDSFKQFFDPIIYKECYKSWKKKLYYVLLVTFFGTFIHFPRNIKYYTIPAKTFSIKNIQNFKYRPSKLLENGAKYVNAPCMRYVKH